MHPPRCGSSLAASGVSPSAIIKRNEMSSDNYDGADDDDEGDNSDGNNTSTGFNSCLLTRYYSRMSKQDSNLDQFIVYWLTLNSPLMQSGQLGQPQIPR